MRAFLDRRGLRTRHACTGVTTKRGKRCTSSALRKTGFKGRSLIDIACRTTGKLTETYSERLVSGTTEKDRNRDGKQRFRAAA